MIEHGSDGYGLSELLACAAAGCLENHTSVFVGTGLPMIAAMLAQRTHAPNLLIVFEAGGWVPRYRRCRFRSATRVPITGQSWHRACTMSCPLARLGTLTMAFLAARRLTPTAISTQRSSVIGHAPKFAYPAQGEPMTLPPSAGAPST